jgi:hypothetical protein
MMHHSELVTMLNLVVFPSLEKFGYDSLDRTSFPNSAIPSIFNRSRCQLTHFDLCGDLRNGTTDDLIAILSDLPTITHFKLHHIHMDNAIMSDQLLRRLTPIHPSEFTHTDRLLPRLESLEFRGYKGFSWSCLAGLVSSPPLTAVQIYALLQRGRNAQIQSAAFPSKYMQWKKWNALTYNPSLTSRALTGLEFSIVES